MAAGLGTRMKSDTAKVLHKIAGKPMLEGSSDPMFRGDASKHNPEDMLVTALSTCHMLSYLHQAVLAGVVVTAYADSAEGSGVDPCWCA